ncbi:hypothetical protein QQ045_023062 [Rhodiola kirilowii]
MEMWASVFVYTIVCLISAILILQLKSKKAHNKLKPPPGPKPLPIIGNLHQLGPRPHQSLRDLSAIHGPIMTLKLGMTRNTIVISSPHFAKQILQTHDHLFSDRIVSDTIRVLNHHNLSVAMLPVSPQWRKLRKAMATQMFSQARLDASQPLRLQKVKELIDYIGQTCLTHQKPLELEHAVFITVLNFLSNTLFSADLAHYQSEKSQEFKHLVVKMLELGGKGNFSDYFPLLRYFDPQGLRRDNKTNLGSIIRVFEDIIDKRMKSKTETSPKNDVLDFLLDQGQEDDLQKLTYQEIKHLCAIKFDTSRRIQQDDFRADNSPCKARLWTSGSDRSRSVVFAEIFSVPSIPLGGDRMGLISGIMMGMLVGIGLMAGWQHMMKRRSKQRIAKAVDIKLMGSLSRDDLKKICGDNFPEWISFPAFEQVKWLNKQLSKLWPYIADAATMVIRESVEPLLEEYRPTGITSLKFSKLSLGTVAPKIEGIRVQSLKEGQITMDIDFRWGGDPSIILAVEAAMVASIPIQLKDLKVFTVVRVIFQLAEEIPCISAVVVALLSEPKPRIDYTLKAVGGSLTAIPGLSDMIDDTVDTIVTDMLQWPHRIVVPIGGIPVDMSELELKPQGNVTVTIVKANDLKNMEMIGKSDPYAVVYIRPLFKVKTKVIENNLNPVWNQTFELIAEDKETQSLVLEVYDQDIGQDKRLGIAKLPLIGLEAETEKEIELRLMPSLDMLKIKDKKDRGTILLKVRYHQFTKEESLAALEEEKRLLEERKRLKAAGVIGSTMDALDGAAGFVGSGFGAVGTGLGAGAGVVSSGFGAVGSGLSKAGKFMGRTITGQSSKKNGTSGTSTPVTNPVENGGGAKPL